jgi:hypothetical protein
MRSSLIALKDLIDEAANGIFGPNWKTLLMECVEEYCKGSFIKPQTYGFRGHGKDLREWSDSDLEEIATIVFTTDLAPNNQHLTIINKARNVPHVKGMLIRSIIWRLHKLRPNTVNENVVRNISDTLKEKHKIKLPDGLPIIDPTHEAELRAIKESFPTPRWRAPGAVNRNGEPYKRLPKVFTDSAIEKIAEQISSMAQRPTKGEIWQMVGEVLGSHEGTQEFNAALVDAMESWEVSEDANYVSGFPAITGSTPGGEVQTSEKTDFSDILRKIPMRERERIQVLAEEFVATLSPVQMKAIELTQHAEFRSLSKMDQADALGLADPTEITLVFEDVRKQTEEFINQKNLTNEDQELLQHTIMVVVCPPTHWRPRDEE